MSAPLIWFTSSWRIACAAHTYGPVIEPSSTPAAGAPFIVAVSSLPVWSPRQSGCRSAPVNTRNPCRGIPLCLRRGQLRGLLSTSSVHDGGGGVGCDGGPPGGGDGCCVGQPGLATIANHGLSAWIAGIVTRTILRIAWIRNGSLGDHPRRIKIGRES